jgi:hypothetical protein
MSSLRTTVASFLRFVAAGLLLLGVTLLAVAWMAQRQGEAALWHWIGGGLSAVAGLALLITGGPLARRLTQDYE